MVDRATATVLGMNPVIGLSLGRIAVGAAAVSTGLVKCSGTSVAATSSAVGIGGSRLFQGLWPALIWAT